MRQVQPEVLLVYNLYVSSVFARFFHSEYICRVRTVSPRNLTCYVFPLGLSGFYCAKIDLTLKIYFHRLLFLFEVEWIVYILCNVSFIAHNWRQKGRDRRERQRVRGKRPRGETYKRRRRSDRGEEAEERHTKGRGKESEGNRQRKETEVRYIET